MRSRSHATYYPGAFEITVGCAIALTLLTGFIPVAWWLEEQQDAVLAERGVTVDGEVIDRVLRGRGGTDPLVAYEVEGQMRTRRVSGTERVGSPVPIRADPLDHRNDRRADRPSSPWWALSFSAILVPGTAAVWWEARNQHRSRERVLRRWAGVSRHRPRPGRRDHAHAEAAVAAVAPPPSLRAPLRRRLRLGAALFPAWIPGAAALLGIHPDLGIKVLPQAALAGALLLAGLTSHVRVTGDGTLTTWTFGLPRRVRLGELVEVGGRSAPRPGDRVAMHGATLLLRDARGGRAAITEGLWRDDSALLALVGAYVAAGAVPVAEPAAQLLGLDPTGDVPPDLRVPRSVLAFLGLLVGMIALLV